MKEEHNILSLIKSGIESNIRLAFTLIKNVGIISEDIVSYVRNYPWLCLEYDVEINHLMKQSSLYLVNTDNTCVPDGLSSLVNLKEINLFDNKITELPEFIMKLINLSTINVSNNCLNKIPEWIVKLPNLRNLDIYCNPLYDMPLFLLHDNNISNITMSFDCKYHFYPYAHDNPHIKHNLKKFNFF